MRQFILAKDFEAVASGASGKVAIVEKTDGSNVGLNLVLQRTPEEGGNILYPIYPKDFTCNVATYSAGNKFQAKFTVPAVEKGHEYSVIFVKKGKQFNERANWSFNTRSNDKDTATTIAKQIVDYVNNNKTLLGLTASNNAGEVTVNGVKVGESFAIKLGDELFGETVNVTKKGTSAFMDAAMVRDLAAKCAADAGFEYTYDEFSGLYPNYDKSPLAQSDSADPGFTVITMRFTEPRIMGTREESVYQIIQVAFPTDAENIGTEDDVLDPDDPSSVTFMALLNEYANVR